MDEENVTQEVTETNNRQVSAQHRKHQKGTGLLIASLILGILSILFFACDLMFMELLCIVSLVLAIIGIILGHVAYKEGNDHGMHLACFIINLVALVLSGLAFGYWAGTLGLITIAARWL